MQPLPPLHTRFSPPIWSMRFSSPVGLTRETKPYTGDPNAVWGPTTVPDTQAFPSASIATAWAIMSRVPSVCMRIKRPSGSNPAMKPTDQMPPIAADLSVRPTIQKLPDASDGAAEHFLI